MIPRDEVVDVIDGARLGTVAGDGDWFVPNRLLDDRGNGPSVVDAPLWLEFWLDFSWFGLIVGFLAFAWISARWDDLFVHLSQRRLASPSVLDLGLLQTSTFTCQ